MSELSWPTVQSVASGQARGAARPVAYAFAAALAPGLRVLDCACGPGDGAWLLARAGAAQVIGVDKDRDALSHAHKHFAHEHVELREGSAESLPLHSGSVELAVSLETIEHVRDAAAFVGELARVLAPGGTLVLSTPLTRGEGRLRPDNPYHVREYDPDELTSLLAPRFTIVERLGLHGQVGLRPHQHEGLPGLLLSGAKRLVPQSVASLSRTLLLRQRAPLCRISAEKWEDAPIQLVVARPIPREP